MLTTRRHLLAAMPVVILAPVGATPHSDAELLALGNEMNELVAALYSADTDEARDALSARYAVVQDRIAVLVPRTPAGLAVRLRLAWNLYVEQDETEHRCGPQLYSDDRTRLLWALIRDAERMAFPSPA